jgi:hypothetical protein
VDYKRKLYVNPHKNMAHCWRCGYKTRNAERMCRQEGLSIPAGVSWGIAQQAARPTESPCRLPDEYTTNFQLPGGDAAWGYLQHARRLSRATIFGYDIGFCPSGRYARRVILPIYQQGTLISYQARAVDDGVEPKYLGPPGPRRKALFNLDRAARSRVLLLVEGIFDALTLPDFAVATLGKQLTEEQRYAIIGARPDAILVLPDADALPDGVRTAEQLTACAPVVRVLSPESKDLNSATDPIRRAVEAVCRAYLPEARRWSVAYAHA